MNAADQNRYLDFAQTWSHHLTEMTHNMLQGDGITFVNVDGVDVYELLEAQTHIEDALDAIRHDYIAPNFNWDTPHMLKRITR